ncbi:hypothetical protein NE619_02165 [Anaerovorax odorimutans]|uniref:TIGR04086 family membrane protein n=1 Tax=Anaerovorax odorimutans TaxID=109327 RepID=A0ABT1RK06_9FIRM|nr:hypothetical protein [Anaerovorax odorimutans]
MFKPNTKKYIRAYLFAMGAYIVVIIVSIVEMIIISAVLTGVGLGYSHLQFEDVGAFGYHSMFLSCLLAICASYLVLRSAKGINQRKAAVACAITITILGVIILIVAMGSNYEMRVRALILLSGSIYWGFISVLPKAERK